MNMDSAANRAVAAMIEGNIDLVQMEIPDLNGILRGKFVAAKKVAGGSKSAVCTVMYQFTPVDDVWVSQHSSYDNGFPDVLGVPDLTTAVELPWRQGTAAVIYDVKYPDGSPFPLSPRNVLRRVAGRFAPTGYTPMFGIPEFAAEMGRGGKVQGADYPARIWGAFMEAAHLNLPVLDWPEPPSNPRKERRIYVPDEECLAELITGYLPGVTIDPERPTTTSIAPPPTEPPPTTIVGDTTPIDTTPPATTVPRIVVEVLRNGTTVPEDVLDPRAPVPSVDPEKVFVFLCDKPPTDIEYIDLER